MKNILVPSDFSACAANASELALTLAKYYGATFHLFTTLDIEKKKGEGAQDKENYNGEDLRKIKNAELLFSEWIAKAKAQNVPIKTYWTGGKLLQNIKEAVVAYDIDFIVMGSHGASGKQEYFIGSNTQKVVRGVHCSVLVVKEDVQNYKIEKVVYASNFNKGEERAFQYMLDFVQPYQPEIHLLEVNNSGWFSQPYILAKAAMDDFKAMCGDLVCKTHFYRDWTVDTGIRRFAAEINADLIVISNEHRHPIKRIVVGSNVEAVVNHAKVPVLSIDLIVLPKSLQLLFISKNNETISRF